LPKRKYTEEHIEYLRQIAKGRYIDEITKLFNEKFGMSLTESAISTLKAKYNIQSNVCKTKKQYTQEQIEYLKQLCKIENITNKEITQEFNKRFNLNKSERAIKGIRKKYGIFIEKPNLNHFPKGHIPWNKGLKGITIGGKETQFKPGNIPPNYKPVGSERISSEGYVEVKIADPNVWKGKHIIEWEKHYGPVPEGHCVIFGDGNKRNFDINNLILVSRKQLLKLNKYDLIKNDADLTRTGVIIADLYSKIDERKKQTRQKCKEG